jgi:hypothetical protein
MLPADAVDNSEGLFGCGYSESQLSRCLQRDNIGQCLGIWSVIALVMRLPTAKALKVIPVAIEGLWESFNVSAGDFLRKTGMIARAG